MRGGCRYGGNRQKEVEMMIFLRTEMITKNRIITFIRLIYNLFLLSVVRSLLSKIHLLNFSDTLIQKLGTFADL